MILIVSFIRSMTGKYCHTAIMIGMFAILLIRDSCHLVISYYQVISLLHCISV